MSKIDRRHFLQVMGGAAALSKMQENIAKAQAIPANDATGTINDVEHIVILMQENRPFDHHFGTLRGVRGFNDPRAVNINLPLASGTGSTPAPVWFQPAGADNVANGFAVPPGNYGGPADGAPVIPPFHVNAPAGAGLTYLPGTNHGWQHTHQCWNNGQHDSWPLINGPMVMSYQTRADIPYHYALADAFTVGDAYHSAIMGPTNPNRMYVWAGCIGNLSNLGPGGTDGYGAGPATYNGLSVNNAYWTFPTFPEVLQAAGITWKTYQDLAGTTFSPDFGDGTGNSFAGNYTDNPLLYFNQYLLAPTNSPLYEFGCTGTQIMNSIPPAAAPALGWLAWAEGLFAEFRSDVASGKLPQVSWIVAPAGYTEHPDYPVDYGAWYISQVLNILVSHPAVFSKTVLIVDYDEADGSFDHIVPPTPPPSAAYGLSTVSIENEIVTATEEEPGGTIPDPIGLNCRVPLLVISPWSKGGYVNSQVFDHTSVIQFIENRFGVSSPNISAWRRAVCGDLTSCFNFASPNSTPVLLPPTARFLPPSPELAGGPTTTLVPTLGNVTVGIPPQEKGIRPAKALPYALNVQAVVNASSGTVTLTFSNSGSAAAVFQVRSGNPSDLVRNYTVQPGLTLSDSWNVTTTYNLSVYGPNGFVRYFNGSIGASAAYLNVTSAYLTDNGGSISWSITNVGTAVADVNVVNAYTGNVSSANLNPGQTLAEVWDLYEFYGWYDVVIAVPSTQNPTLLYRLAGHVETGQDSYSDPAMGGLVTLQTNPS
jgi:phospholipase C